MSQSDTTYRGISFYPPPSPIQFTIAGNQVVQRVSMETAEANIRNHKVLHDWIRHQMFMDKVSTPEALLASHALSEVKETVAVWSQGANAAALAHYSFMLGEVFREGKMEQLYSNWTWKQVEDLDKHLSDTGRGEETPGYLNIAAIKGLRYAEILGMAHVNAEAVHQRFPHVFGTLVKWQQFCALVEGAVRSTGLPFTAIVLQGSAVRKVAPKDLDIGVLVDAEQLDLFLLMEEMITGVVDAMGAAKEQKDEENRNEKRGKSVRKGKIESWYFPAAGPFLDARERVQQWVNTNLVLEKPIQISIIPIGSRFDTKPNMRMA